MKTYLQLPIIDDRSRRVVESVRLLIIVRFIACEQSSWLGRGRGVKQAFVLSERLTLWPGPSPRCKWRARGNPRTKLKYTGTKNCGRHFQRSRGQPCLFAGNLKPLSKQYILIYAKKYSWIFGAFW